MKKITMNGDALTVVGNEIKVGDVAPDFTVLKQDLSALKLSDLKGKKVVITVYPSIDTGVCQLQTKTFNKLASELGDDVEIITISCDLPFALGRFCAADGISNITTCSDHKDLDFAKKYGFEIEELRLLARGTVIVDQTGVVQYVELVDELTDSPNFEAAMNVLKSL